MMIIPMPRNGFARTALRIMHRQPRKREQFHSVLAPTKEESQSRHFFASSTQTTDSNGKEQLLHLHSFSKKDVVVGHQSRPNTRKQHRQHQLSFGEQKDEDRLMRRLQAEKSEMDQLKTDLQPLARSIHHEMASKLSIDEEAPPERVEEYYYSVRVEGDDEFPSYLRWHADSDGKEYEVILDQNEEGHGHEYIGIAAVRISPCRSKVAYLRDTDGSERYKLCVRRIGDANGQGPMMAEDAIGDVGSIAWTGDSNGLLVTVCHPTTRLPHCVVLHRLRIGSVRVVEEEEEDVVLFVEEDSSRVVECTPSKDERYFFVSSSSKENTDIYVGSMADPLRPLLHVQDREDGILGRLDHSSDLGFVRLSNRLHTDYGVDCCPTEVLLSGKTSDSINSSKNCSDGAKWMSLLGGASGLVVDDLDLMRSHAVIYGHRFGIPHIRVIPAAPECKQAGAPTGRRVFDVQNAIDIACPIGEIEPGVNFDESSPHVRFSISSPVCPPRTFDMDLNSGALNLVHQQQCPGVEAELYRVDRLMCPIPNAGKGTCGQHDLLVPVTVLSRKDQREAVGSRTTSSDPSPALFLFYGAYGARLPMHYQPELLPLLDRGWRVCMVHARGGGEGGHLWHQGGKRADKVNTARDVIASMTHMVNEGWVQGEAICLRTASAGGLAAGVVLNEMLKDPRHHSKNNDKTTTIDIAAAILEVPFVDVLGTMSDDELPLTVHEYQEWGNPKTEEAVLDSMLQYDPYRNIPDFSTANNATDRDRHSRPLILTTGSQSDYKVPFWQVLNYCGRLRTREAARKVYYDDLDGLGHSGEGGRWASLSTTAWYWAFLLKAVEGRMVGRRKA